ncbi:hypothetical protein MENTO_v1c04020 [Mesoplasma entomophilum]|uniref:Rhomboid family intramembrane serine protease n=1 Tax=Mesoplasma entomophilum TaxID=2149 RepID=A0A3S5XZS0_9MOLU|nr:hypothetical protein [Mesoplasma entomophilum]ATQ35546.1 hypothetical protein CS528_02090 [Mesoplasma entomophilum]ATZ19508.1 hypothetical protein MENTO_v1c04020 [Mesoplasma entomophilum]
MTEKQSNTYQALVKFLKKEYKYKNVDKKIKESRVLFINNSNEYALIEVQIQGSTETWSNIEMSAQKNFMSQKIKKLKIVISENENNLTEDDTEILVVTTPKELKNNLVKFLPSISKLNESYISIEKVKENKIQDEELNDEIKLNNFKIALNKIKNNNIGFTWIILFFFIIMPVSFTIIGLFMNLSILQEVAYGSGGAEKPSYLSTIWWQAPMIIFGGTNQSLTIAGGQWWRIFTYGFSAMDSANGIVFSALMIFLLTTSLFSISKITEIIIGNVWKLAISFVLAYITLGFVVSATLPYTITSGSLPIIGIMVGILAMNISGETSPIARFGKVKVIWPIILIILAIFNSQDQLSSFSVLMSGIIFGSIFAGLVKKPVKEWTWRENILILFLIVFIVVGIVFAVTLKNAPAYNYNVITALQFYAKNNIGGNFDHYNQIIAKIGWIGRFEQGLWNDKFPMQSTPVATNNIASIIDSISSFSLGLKL